MAWTDETLDGDWSEGPIWTIGQHGIWIGLPNLFIGIGLSHITGAYSDESVDEGKWSDT